MTGRDSPWALGCDKSRIVSDGRVVPQRDHAQAQTKRPQPVVRHHAMWLQEVGIDKLGPPKG